MVNQTILFQFYSLSETKKNNKIYDLVILYKLLLIKVSKLYVQISEKKILFDGLRCFYK